MSVTTSGDGLGDWISIHSQTVMGAFTLQSDRPVLMKSVMRVCFKPEAQNKVLKVSENCVELYSCVAD